MLQPPDRERTVLDDMGGWELFTELVTMFGPQRTTELIGWAFIWGLTGVEKVSELRKDLEARGMSKSAIYRAAADFKRFREEMERQRGCYVPMEQVLKEITDMSSHNRETVVN